MNVPVFDADILALQGWINREGIIPPSGQRELRESVGRVLDKIAEKQAEIERLQAGFRLCLIRQPISLGFDFMDIDVEMERYCREAANAAEEKER